MYTNFELRVGLRLYFYPPGDRTATGYARYRGSESGIPNSQSLIPVTLNYRNSYIRNGHMAVTYVTVSNRQKVDNIFF